MSAPAGLGAWADLPFWAEDWPRIAEALDGQDVLPPRDRTFAALQAVQPGDVRAVILGQDPYPTPGHANGLAFSVSSGTPLPKSLRNIFKELQSDLGVVREDGDLSDWASEGVLLLNTALTVAPGQAGAHARLGWDRLARQVLHRLDDRPRAALLWGRHAQQAGQALARPGHLRIQTAHPSPLSAHRGFFGSRPFSTVNRWLTDRGDRPIRWA